VKLEIHPDPRYLLPDPIETLKAAEQLVREGFVVLPYINADPVLAKRLQDVGTATVMPLGSPIGSNRGIETRAQIEIIIEQATVPVIVDAGLGAPSQAAEALEMGANAVLVNTAIAIAADPPRMGRAFRMAVEAGTRSLSPRPRRTAGYRLGHESPHRFPPPLLIMSLLSVRNLRTWFPVTGGVLRRHIDDIKAVDDVSFEVEAGTTVGLVGESGSGKSTIGKTILKLVPATSGKILFDGKSILPMSENEFRPLRREMQMIFQDPFGSLNPRHTILQIIGEALEIHFPQMKPRRPARSGGRAHENRSALKPEMLERYPHEFSGGQRQRIGIAPRRSR